MDRRDSIKSIVLGSVAGGLALNGCKPDVAAQEAIQKGVVNYGRTLKEQEVDKELLAEEFFTADEMATLGVLCALILPANEEYGSATDAGAPDFIEFMVKDYPKFQTPMRGGLMWLNHESNSAFGVDFASAIEEQQKTILDKIAYPDVTIPDGERPLGVRFFSLARNLTLTAYFTSEMGIKDVGYQGNTANLWDGVPEEVLAQHGVAYEEEWLAKCIDHSTRNITAEWDEEGNLLN